MDDLALQPAKDRKRKVRVQERLRSAGADMLLVSAGIDLRYLAGFAGSARERLTCLVIPADGKPFLVVPSVDASVAQTASADLEIHIWSDGQDPYDRVKSLVRQTARRVIVDDHMWASRVDRFKAVWPGAVNGQEILPTGGQ